MNSEEGGGLWARLSLYTWRSAPAVRGDRHIRGTTGDLSLLR